MPAKILFILIILFSAGIKTFAQLTDPSDRCGTMLYLQNVLNKNSALKNKFYQNELQLQKAIKERPSERASNFDSSSNINNIITIPVVFHIVLINPAIISEAQIQAQLDTLNNYIAGNNADSINIPNYFKPFFGKSVVKFCLARRSPSHQTTNGIIRKRTTKQSFYIDDAVKNNSTGGDDAWDPNKYLNIWISNLSSGMNGYATFPNMSSIDNQGIVISYTTLPSALPSSFNQGKTLLHEVGHFFNLYHIWGDDNGGCTGSDFCDDTPNQANATFGSHTGMITDSCSISTPGIMYQNYMDYSNDDCLFMFTKDQVLRMETTLKNFRYRLIASDACQPIEKQDLDIQCDSIKNMTKRNCTDLISPKIIISNNGKLIITSATLNIRIDNDSIIKTVRWAGLLNPTEKVQVSLPAFSVSQGNHIITMWSSNPNEKEDLNKYNDTISYSFMYYLSFDLPLSEGFESNFFPDSAWDILNPDSSFTWEKIEGISKTGKSSVVIKNINYQDIGQTDYLRLPELNIDKADSAFLVFQVAAAIKSTNQSNNAFDTLEVLLSTDCGNSYISLYKKWGASLITRSLPYALNFVPKANEWRKDSVNLTPFIGKNNILLAFKNTTGNQNNIYLDDIKVYKKYADPTLSNHKFILLPNPTTGIIGIKIYAQPESLKSIEIFNISGEKIIEKNIVVSNYANFYTFNLRNYSAGVYLVKLTFTNKIITQKFVKL